MAKLASIPLVDVTVNALNNNGGVRKVLESTLGVHLAAPVPKYHSNSLRKQVKAFEKSLEPKAVGRTTGKVAFYATCYGNYNSPELGEDFYKVFQHNDIFIRRESFQRMLWERLETWRWNKPDNAMAKAIACFRPF